MDSRFETLLAITVLGYAVAGLLIFAGILYNRKSPQIPYFCAFYLVFSILFLNTVSDHRLSLLNQDVVSKDFVMKNVEKLLDLQNNAEKTQIINLENTSVFIGKKEQFGIDFARLTGKNEIFFYVGNDLDMQKLSSYNGYVDWEKIDDTIFCCQYKQTYHYLSKVRLRVKVIRCLFYVIILFICGTMFFLLQEEIWRT